MKVSALISLSKSTVLKQLKIDDSDILSFVNLALLQIYKKFPINIKEQAIVLQEDINIYDLNPDLMAVSSAFTTENYIRDDDGNLIGGDAAKVVEIPINDDTNPNSFFTPTPGTGMLTYPTTGQIVSILYRAGSISIESDELDQELAITPQYVEPLLMYIGYLGYLSLNAANGKDDTFLAKYNIACASLSKLGITNADTNTNEKLHMRGFV